MANKLMRAVVALLVTLLVGCAAMPQPVEEQQQQPQMQKAPRMRAPVQRERAITQVASQEQQVVGEFPTSRGKPQGKPWVHMHHEGFTGSYQVACGLLGLTHQQCVMYEEMHDRGTCVVMDVPDGVVLDRLTFTRNGKDQIDYGAKVALQNPPSRKTEVCDLGGGVIAMRFHGCNNHAVVKGWNKPLITKVAPAPREEKQVRQPLPTQGGQCAKGVRLNVWEAKAVQVQGVQESIQASRSGGSYSDSGDVSRRFGGTFRQMHASSQLARSTTPHAVTVSLLKQDGRKATLFQGQITGERLVPTIRDFEPGDAVQVVFQNLQEFHSPVSDLRAYQQEFGGCVTNIHAIEK